MSYLLLFDLFKLTPLVSKCMAATFSRATSHMLGDMSVVKGIAVTILLYDLVAWSQRSAATFGVVLSGNTAVMTSPWCIWTLDSTLLSITKALFFQSSISCFVCNLYIFLLGKECKVQKLRPRQELNSQPSNLNSGALSTELWGLSILREFYLYLNFWVFCKLLLEMLVNFGLVLRYKMEKNDLMLQLVNVKLLSCMPAFI